MNDRVLITGASGLLGASLGITLSKSGQDVLGIRRSHPRSLPYLEAVLDLLDKTSVANIARDFKPTAFVHAAALSKVIECEANPRQAHAQNVETTKTLLDIASESRAYVIYISTDQVFDGRRAEYSETDTPAPTHIYGKTKREAELLVEAASKTHLILRSNNIVGRNSGWGRSFTDSLLEQHTQAQPVELFHDQYRSPVHLSAIVSAIMGCIRNRVSGVLHVGGPERLSRYETGLTLAKAYNFSPDLLTSVSMKTHPQASTFHVDGSFCTNKLRSLFPDSGNFTIADGFRRDALMQEQT